MFSLVQPCEQQMESGWAGGEGLGPLQGVYWLLRPLSPLAPYRASGLKGRNGGNAGAGSGAGGGLPAGLVSLFGNARRAGPEALVITTGEQRGRGGGTERQAVLESPPV